MCNVFVFEFSVGFYLKIAFSWSTGNDGIKMWQIKEHSFHWYWKEFLVGICRRWSENSSNPSTAVDMMSLWKNTVHSQQIIWNQQNENRENNRKAINVYYEMLVIISRIPFSHCQRVSYENISASTKSTSDAHNTFHSIFLFPYRIFCVYRNDCESCWMSY